MQASRMVLISEAASDRWPLPPRDIRREASADQWAQDDGYSEGDSQQTVHARLLFDWYDASNGDDLVASQHQDKKSIPPGLRLTLPARIPAAPTPAIALPTMNAVDVGAAPQIAEPISNSAMLTSSASLTLYME